MTNVTRGIIAVCVIALIGLGVFTFTQFNALTDTQDSLAEAEIAGTSVANLLNDANTNIDQLTSNLDTANAEITQVVSERDAANAEITQVVSERDAANAEITQVVSERDAANAEITQMVDSAAATATQSADMMATSDAQITDLESSVASLNTQNDDLASTATAQSIESADTIATANVNATEVADSFSATATQSSMNLADAESTATSLDTAVLAATNLLATQSVALSTAQATINEQATAIAEAESNASGDKPDVGVNPEVNTVDAPTGFALLEGEDFTILVPDDFVAFDLRRDRDEAIETFEDLGSGYEEFVNIAEDDPENLLMVGVSDDFNAEDTLDFMLILSEDFSFNIGMEILVETAELLVGEDQNIIERTVLQIDGRDVGFLISESETFRDGTSSMQAVFMYVEDGNLYLIYYGSINTYFEERREAYEISGSSFALDD